MIDNPEPSTAEDLVHRLTHELHALFLSKKWQAANATAAEITGMVTRLKAELAAYRAAEEKALSVCAICEGEIFWHSFEHDGWPGSWQHNGDFGLDHKATPRGQAEAVEKATAELRAELVAILESDVQRFTFVTSREGWIGPCAAGEEIPPAVRLVELGHWEHLWSGTRYYYRPIEPRDSGESDGNSDD